MIPGGFSGFHSWDQISVWGQKNHHMIWRNFQRIAFLTAAVTGRRIIFIESNVVARTQPFERQAQIFKALTHPARLAILEILHDGEHCVCHMEAHLGYRQAYISQQLAVLREAGLIQDRRDGWNIFYRVARPEVYQLMDVVAEMTGERPAPGCDRRLPSCLSARRLTFWPLPTPAQPSEWTLPSRAWSYPSPLASSLV